MTNFGPEFEPPDQGLCAGNGFVLEPVNSAYRVYRTDGSTVVGPFNVNDIFNVGGAEFTSDPRCYFDASHAHAGSRHPLHQRREHRVDASTSR